MTQWYIKDEYADQLAPLCDLRATFEQRTGGLTTLERLTRLKGCEPSGFLCDDESRAAVITARTGLPLVADKQVPTTVQPEIKLPWEILDHLPELLASDLEQASPLDGLEQASPLNGTSEVAHFGAYRIDIHPTATVYPGVVLDASMGAIRIEKDAIIRPNAVLCGPCWIGEGSTIIDQALMKPNTSIGPFCKIGGEVGGTIFQGFSNKSHDGHLGDSVIGEWVNFGAGTTNSNLLNTYGDVVVRDLAGKRHRTDRQFVGCFVGDHVKFAINSKIMTGSIIGTGSMLACTSYVPSPTPRFAWITDAGERTYQLEKFKKVARSVMQRRGVELDLATEEVMKQLAET